MQPIPGGGQGPRAWGYESGSAGLEVRVGLWSSGAPRTLGELMEEAGVLPRALAVAQDAATGLGKALGVPEERSQNITRFLRSEPGWAERRGWEWWIIDEASMVGSHDWDALLERAKANGTRVLAIGDPAQLGPGGLFSVMAHHPEIPTAELVRVWRMEAKWEQAASLLLRERNPAAADVYADHGRIRDHSDLDELLDSLAAAHTDGQDVLVMAHARQRVDTLNDAMQARLIGDRDPGDEMVIRWADDDGGGGERTVGVGERIRTRHNDYDLVTTKGMTVVNGATWQVARIDKGGLWVRSADRGSVYLPASYLKARDEDTGRPHVKLGYASTVHSAQGRTVDQAVMVVGARTEAELLYVGMTRGRTSSIAVADSSDEDGRTRFLTALANPSAETVAALELIAQERERAERERAAALQLVEDLAGMNPEDARAVLAQQLGDSRWRREAATALQEQQDREQEARELAEREAAEAARWLDDQPDRADPEEIGTAAAEWWSTVDAEDLADAYRRRVGEANRWLAEHGRAADDDLDREAEITQRFRLLTGIAETVPATGWPGPRLWCRLSPTASCLTSSARLAISRSACSRTASGHPDVQQFRFGALVDHRHRLVHGAALRRVDGGGVGPARRNAVRCLCPVPPGSRAGGIGGPVRHRSALRHHQAVPRTTTPPTPFTPPLLQDNFSTPLIPPPIPPSKNGYSNSVTDKPFV